MATEQHFTCPNKNCGAMYRATHEEYPTHQKESFDCKDCGTEVYAWDGKRGNYVGWTLIEMKHVQLGKKL